MKDQVDFWKIWIRELPQILQILTFMTFLGIVLRQSKLAGLITWILIVLYMSIKHQDAYRDLLHKNKEEFLSKDTKEVARLVKYSMLALMIPITALFPLIVIWLSTRVVEQL